MFLLLFRGDNVHSKRHRGKTLNRSIIRGGSAAGLEMVSEGRRSAVIAGNTIAYNCACSMEYGVVTADPNAFQN